MSESPVPLRVKLSFQFELIACRAGSANLKETPDAERARRQRSSNPHPSQRRFLVPTYKVARLRNRSRKRDLWRNALCLSERSAAVLEHSGADRISPPFFFQRRNGFIWEQEFRVITPSKKPFSARWLQGYDTVDQGVSTGAIGCRNRARAPFPVW